MKLFCLALCPLVFLIVGSKGIRAQLSAADSTFYANARSQLIETYRQSVGEQAGIYNGIQYVRHRAITRGHAYFGTGSLSSGSVIYDGVVYNSVRLLYDQLRDELVTEDFTRTHLVQLIKERVTSFKIGEHQFISLKFDSASEGAITPGFYEVLYSGKSIVLKKETKQIREEVLFNEGPGRVIEARSRYYIRHPDRYYEVGNKRDLLEVFGSKRKEVNEYLKKNKIKFNNNTEEVLIAAAALYDQLTP